MTPDRRRRFSVLVLVLALLVGGTLTATGLYAVGAFSTEIVALPYATDGENPFAPSIGDGQPVNRPQGKTGISIAGDSVGLYGGTLNDAACDRTKLVTFLQQNPEKGAAWAGVLGIAPDGIASYVAELTPMILRSDTAVTNHGFANGTATTLDSVLQAGSAVLVDRSGVPRVRCKCGNPLTPARNFSRPSYPADAWPEFSPDQITAVQPAANPITTFVVINLANDTTTIDRPAGTAGEGDEGRLEDASVEGTYTITRTLVSCTGITDPDESCDDYRNQTNTWTVRCPSKSSCTVNGEVTFTLAGSSWSASGDSPPDSAFTCFDVPVPTTFRTEFTPATATASDGRWAAQTLSGRIERRADGTSRCPQAYLFVWKINGTRTG
ncbi:MAG: DUF6777 domain-containing protein [Pseudonocardia sp.]